MFVRIRWFALGVLTTVGSGAYVLAKLRRLRARLTPANLRRVSAISLADALDGAARAVAPPDRSPAPGEGLPT